MPLHKGKPMIEVTEDYLNKRLDESMLKCPWHWKDLITLWILEDIHLHMKGGSKYFEPKFIIPKAFVWQGRLVK